MVICATKRFIDIHEVLSDAPVSVYRLFNCKYCCIYLEDSATTVTLSAVKMHRNSDAFSVLMANSRRVYLPPKLVPPEGKQLQSDQCLENDLIGTVYA